MATTPGLNTQPFRFLDLPTELRLMVYQRIPITTQRTTIKQTATLGFIWPKCDDGTEPSSITLVKKSTSANILRTCKFIKHEAECYIKTKLESIAKEPLRIVADFRGFQALTTSGAFLEACIYWARYMMLVLEEKEKPSYTTNEEIRLDHGICPSETISHLYASKSPSSPRASQLINHFLTTFATRETRPQPRLEIIVTPSNTSTVYSQEQIESLRDLVGWCRTFYEAREDLEDIFRAEWKVLAVATDQLLLNDVDVDVDANTHDMEREFFFAEWYRARVVFVHSAYKDDVRALEWIELWQEGDVDWPEGL
ncbi:hypothetical protein CC80DRAFT_505138 [Byssothecium circinans]|uniref:F-box domain-containing protein n=1 Tax=Byssothecium circinans TaxID=147558 RepID=A0A6A5TYP5_9PLEO|nr:hypothetical protein CC80DRAFT_505138 [Byssothecium circinans]